MLRNVLEDYLSSIREREFDYPLSALLQSMGFYDIHFTHGRVEFGKDFIAKKVDGGTEYQYAIQSKRGNINQHLWRNEIKGQLEEAVELDLSHPQFNTSLPRKVILVTTGRLSDNARLITQEFKRKFESERQVEELIFWEQEQLIQYSEEYGLTGIYQNTAKGLGGLGQFYLTYSKAINGILSDREIEEFSRLWLDDDLDYRKRIFRAAIEADIIAAMLTDKQRTYEALITQLGLARIIMKATYENDDPFIVEIFEELLSDTILPLSRQFFNQFKSDWEEAGKSLIRLCFGNCYFPMLDYLVWCARSLEVASLYAFLTDEAAEKDETIAFIVDFIETEEGSGHIPGDRYAVTVIWPALALLRAGRTDKAIALVQRSLVWLCDKVEQGAGIAYWDAEEYQETVTLLGHPFDFIKLEEHGSYYLATVVSDLAAFIGDKKFYEDVENDLAACEVAYTYWQFPDTEGLFTIDTEDCTAYANVPFHSSIERFEDYEYAEHIKYEPDSFRIIEKAGIKSLTLLSIFLKDRYFPKAWKQIISEGEIGEEAGQLGA
jgi:restriction endonuclease